MTIFTDINMLDGEGEAARAVEIGAEIAEKRVADVTESAGRDAVDVVETSCGGGLSFLFTTKVATQQGEQAIGMLKVGEKVWSYNPKTKKMELKPILHVWINHDNDLVDLTITHTNSKQDKATKPVSEVIHTNKKHPFLTVEKGFLPVGQMKLGMHVVEANGQVGMVSGWKVVPGVKVMYNLEVAQDHTFVVGVGMWVVHNCGPVDVNLSRSKYPETSQHIEDAIASGQPDTLTLDRSGAKANRRASLKGIPTLPGLDRDEYRMAFTSEGGAGADIRHINPSDNQGAGSVIGHQLRSYPNGTRFRINITP